MALTTSLFSLEVFFVSIVFALRYYRKRLQDDLIVASLFLFTTFMLLYTALEEGKNPVPEDIGIWHYLIPGSFLCIVLIRLGIEVRLTFIHTRSKTRR